MNSTQSVAVLKEQTQCACNYSKTRMCPLVLFGLALGAAASAADLSGEWEFAGKSLGDTSYARITLKVEGEKLTGRLNELKLEGKANQDKLTFNAKRPNGDNFGD